MPSKNIVDFANQIKTYMRGAEVVASKNLFDNQLTTTTEGNVTFTKNADKSVSTSGTSNADWVTVALNSAQFLKAGDYTISGISDGSQETYRFFVAGSHIEVSGSSVSDFVLYGGSKNFTVTQDSTVSVSVIVRYSGVNMTGKTFYPMITLASETDQTYMPYFEPLKDKLAVTESAFTDIISGASVTDNTNYLIKIGNVVYAWLYLTSVTVAAWTKIAGIPEGYRPIHDMFIRDAQDNRQYKCSVAGSLSCADALSNNAFVICTSWITP